jgi:hypothetical protein
MDYTQADIDFLLSPTAIRERTKRIYDLALEGKTHFSVDESKLEGCADFVMEVINENYPTYDIPFHSRWGHFKVGGIDRVDTFNQKIAMQEKIERVRTKLDLVITSVLLDAGAGATWSYNEDGTKFNRSEGLAVASYHMFSGGHFSSKFTREADSVGLKNISAESIEEGFQVTADNPLVGVEGRAELLNKLGEACENETYFPKMRPGSIVDYLINKHGEEFEVSDILNAVLLGLGSIWPGRISLGDTNLGDCWHHSLLGEQSVNSLIPFHKLSQWLTYSMVEPMLEAGLKVTGAEKLTGLAEYRNGGLFLDYGVINLRDENNYNIVHKPSSELVIEWRALTVTLLDKMGELVQKKLNKTPEDFPLAKVLEGGTWWAGRKIAAQKREDKSTPIKLDSDGTVF